MATWKVTLSDHSGSTHDYMFTAGWDPEKDFISDDLIKTSAAAQAWIEGGKKTQFIPVACELVT